MLPTPIDVKNLASKLLLKGATPPKTTPDGDKTSVNLLSPPLAGEIPFVASTSTAPDGTQTQRTLHR